MLSLSNLTLVSPLLDILSNLELLLVFVDPEVSAAKSCGSSCLPKLSVFSVEVDIPSVVEANSKRDDW